MTTGSAAQEIGPTSLEGWTYAKLGQIAEQLQYGYTASAERSGVGPKFLRITDIQNGQVNWDSVPVCSIDRQELSKFALAPGDIVFARTGATTGKSFLIHACPVSSVFASYLIRLRTRPGVRSAFLNLFFNTPQYWQFISESVSGIAQPNCNASKLADLDVPLPPLAEQNRIIEKVEQLLAPVNTVRAQLARVPLILRRFRQAVLAAACSGRLTAEWRETHEPSDTGRSLLNCIFDDRKSRYETLCEEAARSSRKKPKLPKNLTRSEIGAELAVHTVPATWVWATWDDLVDWVTYGFTRPMPHVEEGIPIVTAKNIVSGKIDFSTAHRTTKKAFADLSEKDRPNRGEILLTKDGSIGRAAIVETDRAFCVNQSVAVLRLGGLTALVPYLLRVIQAPFAQSLIEEGAKGTAIPHISITTFGTFPVPLPSLDEQREIVRRIEALFKLADSIETRLAAATAMAEKLTQAILAKAFRGELVPTEAELARREGRSYEPASALLDRIRTERESSQVAKKVLGKPFPNPPNGRKFGIEAKAISDQEREK